MKCTKCNTESTFLINIYYDNKMNHLCDKCFIDLEPKLNDISRIDEQINEAEQLLKRVENILKHTKEADLTEIDESISAFVFTPSKVITLTKRIISELLKQKEKLLSSMNEKERLTYKLKIAIQNENYEFAVSIRDKLNK